jgi:hypothetical protein
MPLHIFLGDEELLYFISRVEVVEIQIRFEFKLVYNLQKGLKIIKDFLFSKGVLGRIPGLGPAGLLSRAVRERASTQPSGLASLMSAHPSHVARSDPLSVNPTQ